VQVGDELPKSLVALDAAEGLSGVEPAGGDSAKDELPVAPAGGISVGAGAGEVVGSVGLVLGSVFAGPPLMSSRVTASTSSRPSLGGGGVGMALFQLAG
jgi:hypothetical protein